MIRNKYIQFTLFVVVYAAFWNLILWVFNRQTYSFTLNGSIFMPLTIAIILGYVFFLHKRQNR